MNADKAKPKVFEVANKEVGATGVTSRWEANQQKVSISSLDKLPSDGRVDVEAKGVSSEDEEDAIE